MRIPRSLYEYSSFIQLKHTKASSKWAVHGITLGDMDPKSLDPYLRQRQSIYLDMKRLRLRFF